MTAEELLITVARVAGSLPVLVWPFAGAIVAIMVDLADLFMMNLLDLGGVSDYQSLDKRLDLVYMAMFLVVVLRWNGTSRSVGIGLFAYRIVGVAAFEITNEREVLLFFPNVFEFWVLFVAAAARFRPGYAWTRLNAALWLAPLIVLKEAQELVLHGFQSLDQYRAVDVVAAALHWLAALV